MFDKKNIKRERTKSEMWDQTDQPTLYSRYQAKWWKMWTSWVTLVEKTNRWQAPNTFKACLVNVKAFLSFAWKFLLGHLN